MNDFLSREDLEQLVALRRDLHAHPELGFEEERTAKIVKEYLEACGIPAEIGIGKTGGAPLSLEIRRQDACLRP